MISGKWSHFLTSCFIQAERVLTSSCELFWPPLAAAGLCWLPLLIPGMLLSGELQLPGIQGELSCPLKCVCRASLLPSLPSFSFSPLTWQVPVLRVWGLEPTQTALGMSLTPLSRTGYMGSLCSQGHPEAARDLHHLRCPVSILPPGSIFQGCLQNPAGTSMTEG